MSRIRIRWQVPGDAAGDRSHYGNSSYSNKTLRSLLASHNVPKDQHRAAAPAGPHSSLPQLVPNPHPLADLDGACVSSQGAAYFEEHYCSGWNKYIHASACGSSESLECEVSGNVIFDDGADMYDVGRSLGSDTIGCVAENARPQILWLTASRKLLGGFCVSSAARSQPLVPGTG